MSGIILRNVDTVQFEVATALLESKVLALDEASLIQKVNSQASADAAGKALKSLQKALKQAKDAKMVVEVPLNALKAKVMDFMQEFEDPIEREKGRLNRLLLDFQMEQRRLAEEEARKQREEVERLEKEKQKLLSQAQAAKTFGAAEKAEQKALAIEDQLAVAKTQVVVAEAPKKIAGVSIREDWDYELIDIKALHTARPDLTEVTITDKRAQIKAFLKAANGKVEIPGIRIFKKAGAVARG